MDITPKGFEKKSASFDPADLDKPIDQVVVPGSGPAPEPVVEPVVETPAVETPKVEEEEEKVPKSRFLTMHKRALEAERERDQALASTKEQAAPAVQVTPEPTDLPDYWVKLYGDSDLSRQAFAEDQKRLAAIREEATEAAITRLRQQDEQRVKQEEEAVAHFEKGFKDLSDAEGREFTAEEQNSILDIIEEYSPKDKDGNVLREYMMPIDKAYEVHKLKTETTKTATRKARNDAAAISSSQSDGTPSSSNAGDFIPGRRGQWESKLPTN